jgi:hypothetical protein
LRGHCVGVAGFLGGGKTQFAANALVDVFGQGLGHLDREVVQYSDNPDSGLGEPFARRLRRAPALGGRRQIGASPKPLGRNPPDMAMAYQQNFGHWRCPAKISVPRMRSSAPRSLISLLNAAKEQPAGLTIATGTLDFLAMPITRIQ